MSPLDTLYSFGPELPGEPVDNMDALVSTPFNPSEFEGVALSFDGERSAEPATGLARAKERLPLFDAELSFFDLWYAKIETGIGCYHLGAPRRIERDLRPGSERIKLDFMRLPVIKSTYLKEFVIYNGLDEPIAVRIGGYWLQPGDNLDCSYSLKV